jgi:hypothetical protein
MKELFYFLQWQWRKFELWQKCWIFAMAFVGGGLTAPDTWRIYLIGTGGSIIMFFMLKWTFWDGIQNAWRKYQEEKQQVVDIMSGKEKI